MIQPIDNHLQRIVAGYGLVFGHRLLEQAEGQGLGFRQFLDIAAEMIQQQPEDAAIYLAAMVALDIQRVHAEGAPPQGDPSRN